MGSSFDLQARKTSSQFEQGILTMLKQRHLQKQFNRIPFATAADPLRNDPMAPSLNGQTDAFEGLQEFKLKGF